MICKANLICIWAFEFSLSELMPLSCNYYETLLLEKFSTAALFTEVMYIGFTILIYIHNECKGKERHDSYCCSICLGSRLI